LASRATADRYSGVISGFSIMCLLMRERQRKYGDSPLCVMLKAGHLLPSPDVVVWSSFSFESKSEGELSAAFCGCFRTSAKTAL
jgi:hypothetical protein